MNITHTSKTRKVTVAGFGGQVVTVTVVGGTLTEAKQQARHEAHSLFTWPSLRPVVTHVEVI